MCCHPARHTARSGGRQGQVDHELPPWGSIGARFVDVNLKKDMDSLNEGELFVSADAPKRPKDRPRFREWAALYLRVADKNGILVPLVLNEIQLEIDDEWERQEAEIGFVRIIVLKARQMGASVYFQARLFFNVWWYPNYKAGVMAHDIPGCDFVFERTQTFHEELPEALKLPQKYGNRREIAFEAPHRSSLRSNVAKGRGGFGRGGTIMGVHMSEVAFWKVIRGQSTRQGQATAIKNSVPRTKTTAIVIESTANGMGGEFYEFWVKAKQGRNEFKPMFFPWGKFKEYRLVGKKPDDYFAEAEWVIDEPMLRAMGYDDEQLAWRRYKIANDCEGDVDAFKQEYPATDVEAFLTSGRPVFLASLVNRRLMEVKERIEGVYNGKDKKWDRLPEPYPTFSFDSNWKVVPNRHGEFRRFRLRGSAKTDDLAIVADVAEGIEKKADEKQGDYSVVDVFDRRNNEQIAQWRGHCDPDRLGDVIYHIGKLYGFPVVIPESNNHGKVTIKRLQNLKYPRLFFYQKVADAKMFSEVTYTKYGWETNPKTKPFSIGCLQRLWRNRNIIIHSPETLQEHLTYVRKQNGTTEAESGRYDDCVMVCAIFAAWAEYHPHGRILVEESPPNRTSPVNGKDVLNAIGVNEEFTWSYSTWGRRL